MKLLQSLIALSLLTGIALAQKDDAIRKDLEPYYRKWVTAMERKQLESIMTLLDEDFTWILHEGNKLNRKETESALKEQFSNVESGRWQVRITGIMGSTSLANITVEYTFTGKLLDAGKRPYDAKLMGTERQLWQKGVDGWKQKRAEILNLKMVSGREALTSTPEGPPPSNWIYADPPPS